MRNADTNEFVSSLLSYLNASQTDEGVLYDVQDSRGEQLAMYLALPPEQIVELMGEVPHDLAALLSGEVFVADLDKAQALIANAHHNLEALWLAEEIGEVTEILGSSNPQVVDLLAKFLETQEGCTLLAAITLLLFEGLKDEHISPFLRKAG